MENYQLESHRLAEEVENLTQLLQQERQAHKEEVHHLGGRLSTQRHEMAGYHHQIRIQQNQIQGLQNENWAASNLGRDSMAAFAQQ